MSLMGAAAITAGGSLLGGALGYFGAKSQASQQAAMMKAQMDAQREFAQKGVRWKVADAKEAGISPLAALGAQTHSFSPMSVGGGPSPMSHLGNAISDMGQNIGRSLMATATNEERKRQILQTQNLRLKNQKLKQDLAMDQQGNSYARVSNAGNPPMPNVQNRPSLVTGQNPSKKQLQSGDIADQGFAFTGTGLAPIPSSDVKERIEDQIIPEAAWAKRVYGGALTSDQYKPTMEQVRRHFPKATDVEFSVMKGEYVPVYKGKGRTPWKKWKDYVTGWQDNIKHDWRLEANPKWQRFKAYKPRR
jgi:hypothetical protein